MADDLERLSAKQIESILHADARVNIWHGSVRSGKTLASVIAFMHFLATSCPRQGRPVIIGKTMDTIYRNVFSTMVELDPDAVAYTRKSPVARIYGREVDVIGAPNVDAESRIRGATIPAAYVDEGSLLPDLGFWLQLLNRQITLEAARTFLTTNPDNPLHWLKADVIDRAGELDHRVWHFDLDDNPILTVEAKDLISRQNTGVWHRRNVLGLWVVAEGVIYDMFDPDVHVVVDLPRIVEWILALDPGASSTHAAVLLGLGEDGVIYAAREWRWTAKDHQRSLTDLQVAEELDRWLGLCEAELGRIVVDRTIVDSEDSSMVRQIWLDNDGRFPGRFGAVRGAYKGPGSVKEGIRTVSSLMAIGRLKTHVSCTSLIAERQTYSWDPKAAAKGEDKPVKANDHSSDAERYGISAAWTWWREWIATASEFEQAA